MQIVENGVRIDLLGDPHLGRSFVHGVLLARRGERENRVWEDFTASINNTKADLHVCMGDLFDKWMVSYDVIMQAANAYMRAKAKNPQTEYLILKGNHDWIRDLERSSAFDVFTAIVRATSGIKVITEPTMIQGMLFCPWLPIDDASEVVEKYKNHDTQVAFGHWDTEFGEHNMVPTKAGVARLYTGHIHKPTSFTRDGVEVVVVGSMQPYAHGEEADDSLYLTLSKDEAVGRSDLKDKCVRVRLKAGEILDDEIDCLQLTIQREEETETDDSPTVTLGDFDMEALFRKAFAEAAVTPEITEIVLGQYLARRIADAA